MFARHPIAVLAIAVGAAVTGRPLAAQIDYRNLDEGRPVRTEDAYPVERYAFELSLPYEYANELGDARAHSVAPELSYGILPNTMVGVQLPFAALDAGGRTDWGFAGPRAYAFYNLNTESAALPALALRADVALPFGALAGDAARVGLTGIATRSWGRTRAHLNGTIGLGADAGAAAVHGVPEWTASVAVDHTFLRQSLLVIGELGARQAASGAPAEVSLGIGSRLQLTPTLVLDAGLARRLTRRAGDDLALTLGLSHAFALSGLMPSARSARSVPSASSSSAPSAPAALERRSEQFYHPGGFNWRFLKSYPEAARLFNAFDYGHAVLYEQLLTAGPRAPEALAQEYRHLTRDLLVHPPRFAIAEEAVEPTYAKLAWQAKQMFDWAHVLHRQIYDVYADERLPLAAKDSLIERLTDYYLSRKDLAFVPVPKAMALMDEQRFSQGFRREYPAFNGLIWAYHWLQVGLYEPLIVGRSAAEKKQRVQVTVARFWQMVQAELYPTAMPMTSAIAPTFSAAHPRAAVIFDNLHMMHDIISDVLASATIPRSEKRAVIYRQLAEFRDPTTNVISMDEWRSMAEHMGGVDAMGGSALDLLRPLPGADAGHGAGHSSPTRPGGDEHHRHRQ